MPQLNPWAELKAALQTDKSVRVSITTNQPGEITGKVLGYCEGWVKIEDMQRDDTGPLWVSMDAIVTWRLGG